MRERGQQAIDADRRADGGDRLAEEAHDQVVVTAAAEDGAELRRVEQDRFEDRAGVVGEAAGDGEIERDAIVVVAEGVEMIGDFLDDVDLRGGVIETAKSSRTLRDDVARESRLMSRKRSMRSTWSALRPTPRIVSPDSSL